MRLRQRSLENVVPKEKAADPTYVINHIEDYGLVWGPFACIFTVEQHDDGLHWHLDVSHTERYPTWDELMAFRACVFEDDQEVTMIVPNAEEYMNKHDRTFHLWHKTGSSLMGAS